MTDRDALLAAIRTDPADNTARLALADWLDEHGDSDADRASAEFVRQCFAPVTYTVVAEITDDDAKARRKRSPGWREWLSSDGAQWWRCDGKPQHVVDQYPIGAAWSKVFAPDVMNWHRLVPRLWGMLQGKTQWRRDGGKIRIRGNDHGDLTLEFRRGFLSRVEFRDWRAADRMLERILADQPLTEPGIVGQPFWDEVDGSWYVDSEGLGPLYAELSGIKWPHHIPDGRELLRVALATVMRERALAMQEA